MVDKLMPGCFYSQIRVRVTAVFDKDVSDGWFADCIFQINKLICNLIIDSSWIFLFEFDDKLYNFLADLWSTGFFTIFIAIIFFNDQFGNQPRMYLRYIGQYTAPIFSCRAFWRWQPLSSTDDWLAESVCSVFPATLQVPEPVLGGNRRLCKVRYRCNKQDRWPA